MNRTVSLTRENSEPGTESYFIRCDCYGHLMNVAVYEEDFGTEDAFVYLTLYGTYVRDSWPDRFRAAWRMLRRGLGAESDFALHHEESLALGQKLVELSEKLKGK